MLGSITYTTNDTKAACVCDSSRESRTCRDIHASQEDRVLDFEEVGDRGPDLLRGRHGDQSNVNSKATKIKKVRETEEDRSSRCGRLGDGKRRGFKNRLAQLLEEK